MPPRPTAPPRPLRTALVLLVALVLTTGADPAGAAPVAVGPKVAAGPGKEVRARYAILVDPATGEVLWGRRSRRPVPPASLTKMLTALAVRASLDLETVTVASGTAAAQPARRLAMKRGQKLTVEQALKALMIVSANDVAVMLAEAAGGSVARFALAMDAESARLGLRGSSWRNPNGLDAPGHRSTAFDLAILARAVLRDPWLARVVRKRTPPSSRQAAAATRGGRTLIAVVLHSPDNAADAGRMLDWGFAHPGQAGTGPRLPEPVRPASVNTLLDRPSRAVERHQPAVPGALASAGLARVAATPVARPVGAQPDWSWRDRQRVVAGIGAVVALLMVVALAVHRLRQRA